MASYPGALARSVYTQVNCSHIPSDTGAGTSDIYSQTISDGDVYCGQWKNLGAMLRVKKVWAQLTELENVKSFTRTNINKPDFTPEKRA